MADEHNVHIVSWPGGPAGLEHHFAKGETLPVSVSFGNTPARVVVMTPPQERLVVSMNMNLRAQRPCPCASASASPSAPTAITRSGSRSLTGR